MSHILKAFKMEITDCAYPLIKSVEYSSDPKELFKDLDLGLFFDGLEVEASINPNNFKIKYDLCLN